MIPLRYRLREGVRLEPDGRGSWRLISLSPLYVVRINEAAAQLLQRTRRGATVGELAAAFRVTEERIFDLCQRFSARGILEVARARSFTRDEARGGDEARREGEARRGGGELDLQVSIIIPTLDRAAELEQCLRAVRGLAYPPDLVEVIVVDDGSRDPASVAEVAAGYGARLLVNDRNRGPAYSRNRAAVQARGEIFAFLDSDCVPDSSWLAELTPYFAWKKVGAVGGRTRAYLHGSQKVTGLDRYEEVSSPLDLGPWLHIAGPGSDTFYLPTCNLLVRRSAYAAVRGLRERLRVGEDVDLCWRLRARGYYLVYAPEGVVRHKHRGSLQGLLRQRLQYGTSEAVLHRLHPEKRKRFPLLPAPLATVALTMFASVSLEPRLLPALVLPTAWDALGRLAHLRREQVDVPATQVWGSVVRTHLGMLYVAFFHLQRYYLWPLALLGKKLPGAWVLGASALVYSAGVDYQAKRPHLDFASFLLCYTADHLAYQTGVIAGCLKARSFRSYLPSFSRSDGVSRKASREVSRPRSGRTSLGALASAQGQD